MGPPGAQRLPAPSSNLLLEISLCRLLASCEEIAAGQDKGREDLRQWQTSPTYHHVRRISKACLSTLNPDHFYNIFPDHIPLFNLFSVHRDAARAASRFRR